MKLVVAVLFLVGFAYAENALLDANPVFGYAEKYGIPLAEKIRAAEEAQSESRIVGGSIGVLGQFPYQAGLLISFVGIDGTGVCGAFLVSPNRLVTAAHCWFDGRHQAWRFTVVLGSVTLFTGGTRIDTSAVVAHPNWSPTLFRNDIAVIYLPNPVSNSAYISPVSLPEGSELEETFEGVQAVASGFGLTSDGGSISSTQSLSHVTLNVIANSVCSAAFPLILQPSNICTSGVNGVGTCNGDSGGPLVVTRGQRRFVIGVTAFGSALGCQSFLPAAFARVTSFVGFINQHI